MRDFRIFLYFVLMLIFAAGSASPQMSSLGEKVVALSKYIGDLQAPDPKETERELSSVDSIFIRALSLSNGDISEALAACIWACLPVRNTVMVTPFTGIKLVFPFISADDETFLGKNKKLPRYLFFDSPDSKSGDIDKLSHFFGAAYLEYNKIIPGSTNFIGWFVEVFEESFKVDSKISRRDLIANSLGIMFGDGLRKNENLLPSKFLKLYQPVK
ncbi:MAG: hypothetical protein LC102_13030 [Ignavibacteriales bacterium]|nr:MAG: hypothetical protein F9K26_00110 [Ignavibacteriaceae bacterium]MBW7871814.1 hypothetical protein [Ignavibacteria bacterium]MCZ2144336.1 hypothetical protein [Ignavibacteriales bacterium]OQY72750.1 MAG: hypothetical protein B6D45_08800 [Ignavibacteriales bacterium UTCHB3]MBZ0198175.1 hypothetical protein [Ignavibacteriaceae bacterium]